MSIHAYMVEWIIVMAIRDWLLYLHLALGDSPFMVKDEVVLPDSTCIAVAGG